MEIIGYSQGSFKFLGYLSLEGWAIITLEAPREADMGYDLCGQFPNYFLSTFSFAQESFHPSCKSVYQYQ
jgi:hypothetical protein